MASGPVCRTLKAEHMAAPTNAANVKNVLANPEPSTHAVPLLLLIVLQLLIHLPLGAQLL